MPPLLDPERREALGGAVRGAAQLVARGVVPASDTPLSRPIAPLLSAITEWSGTTLLSLCTTFQNAGRAHNDPARAFAELAAPAGPPS